MKCPLPRLALLALAAFGVSAAWAPGERPDRISPGGSAEATFPREPPQPPIPFPSNVLSDASPGVVVPPPSTEPVTAPGWTTPAVPCSEPVPGPVRNDLVSELALILNETKSLDTFLVTLRLLENMGPQAEAAIPAVLRNAERLGLFRDNLTAKDGRSELVEDVACRLERIRSRKVGERVDPPLEKTCGWSQPAVPCVPCVPVPNR